MIVRFFVALVVGAILGVERELVGKEAGVRTEMLVAGGAAIFAMIGLSLPYIASDSLGAPLDILAVTSSFGIIANIVVGVGFLGAGLVIKIGDRPRGITTAAYVWFTAAIGALVGIGLMQFAAVAAILIALILFLLRKMDIPDRRSEHEKGNA